MRSWTGVSMGENWRERKTGREVGRREGMREGQRNIRNINKPWALAWSLSQNCSECIIFRKRRKAEYVILHHTVMHFLIHYLHTIRYSRCFIKVSSEFKFELIFGSVFNHTMLMQIWVSQNPLSLGFTIGIWLINLRQVNKKRHAVIKFKVHPQLHACLGILLVMHILNQSFQLKDTRLLLNISLSIYKL